VVSSRDREALEQGFTNPDCQITREGKLCTVASNICGQSSGALAGRCKVVRLYKLRVLTFNILKHPQPTFLPQCQRPSFTPIQNNRQYYSSIYFDL